MPLPRRGNGTLVSASALLWGLQFAFLNPSVGLLLVALYDATPAQVGWALAAYNISGFVSTLIVPTRADRTGDYLRPMLGCGVLTVLLVTALALATSLPVAVLALVALGGPAGVGMGLLFAHQRHTGASVPEIMRTRAFFSFAWVAGPPVATLLLGLLGNRSVLWSVAGIAVVTIAVTLALLRVRGAPEGGHPARTADDHLGRVVRARPVLLLVSGFVLLASANNAAVSSTTLFVSHRLGLGVIWGGIALGTAAALEIPLLLGLGRLSARYGPRRLVAAGAVSGVAYYVSMAVLTGPVELVAAQVLNAAAVAAVSGIGLTVFQEVVPRPGLASGLFMNTTRVGAILAGPVITLGGLPGLGYSAVFAACAGLALGGFGLVVASRSARPSRIAA